MEAKDVQTIAAAKIEDKTLTKREQYAITVLQGLLANSESCSETPQTLVGVAVRYADLLADELSGNDEVEEEEQEADYEEADDDCDCPVCEARRDGRDGATGKEVLAFLLKQAMSR